MQTQTKLDIFSGGPDGNDVMWICTVLGLREAKEMMEKIAAKKPGPYFIVDIATREILAQTETLSRKDDNRRQA
jgi:hypothetical protein